MTVGSHGLVIRASDREDGYSIPSVAVSKLEQFCSPFIACGFLRRR